MLTPARFFNLAGFFVFRTKKVREGKYARRNEKKVIECFELV
jgi:hypothetical protein